MRTTVTLTLDEALVTQAKEAALAAGTTLSGLVEAALRRALAEATVRVEAPPFKLVTFGGGGLLPGVDPGGVELRPFTNGMRFLAPINMERAYAEHVADYIDLESREAVPRDEPDDDIPF